MSDVDGAHLGEVLEVLACDISARLAGAPGFGDVTGSLLSIRREPGALLVDFDATAAPLLERIVEAERRCCAEIGWHLERSGDAGYAKGGRADVVRLRIEGSAAQLDAAALLIGPRS